MTMTDTSNTDVSTREQYVQFFRNSSPYIHAHRHKTFVVALGGEAVEGDNFQSTMHDIALLQSLGIRIVLVHGARPQIDQRSAEAGLDTDFCQNLRVTDAKTMQCVKEAAGHTRYLIESALSMSLPNSPMHCAQVRLIGGNFIVAKPVGIRNGTDFQHTGEVRRVDAAAIAQQLNLGALVLISPIGFSPTGEAFNLGYRDVATRTAIALGADKLILLEEEQGILDSNGQLIRSLSLPELNDLKIRMNGSVQHDMLASAYQAGLNGVSRIHLISAQLDGALLSELFTRDGCGTLIMKDNSEVIRPATIDDVGGILDLISPLEEQGVLVKRSRELLETEISRFSVVQHPEGMLVGCAALYPFPSSSAAELACVVVHPEFGRRGIASRLLEALGKDARAIGMKNLFVLTTQTAHWFREKGFVESSLEELPEQKKSLYNYQRNSRIFRKVL